MTHEQCDLKIPSCHIPTEDKAKVIIKDKKITITYKGKVRKYKTVIFKEDGSPGIVEDD